jgi:tricarballylate dehydrogenase
MLLMADEFDVITIGCGIAGLSAAVSALQAGAKVAIVERAPVEDRGGNTRWTESFWRMQSDVEVADDLEERLADNAALHPDPSVIQDASLDYASWPGLLKAAGLVDPNLVAALVREAPTTLQWLLTFGVKFDVLPLYFLSQTASRRAPIGGGLALIEALAGYAENYPDQVRFYYETRAHDLIQDAAGRVAGIKAFAPGNRPLELRAPNVILASGGFQGNQEMLARYIGPQALYTRPVARGGYYNRGEGIRMALDAGAAPCGNYASYHAQPIDPRSGDPEPVVLNYALGALVNQAGQRFTDEGPAMTDAVYEVVTRRINQEAGGIAYAIFDAKLDDVDGWATTVRSRVPAFSAASLSELAAKIGVPADELATTVATFNAACPAPDSFDPLVCDGLATTGIEPRKSNWARPIDTPPFRAWPIIAANCFTFGGLKVNERARVINLNGDEIPGLYAAGETVGLYYKVYPGATSVMRGAVTGRIAGQDAASRRNI